MSVGGRAQAGRNRPVVFLSDYGLKDEFVGICHGVMLRIDPELRVVDLVHSVSRHDVLQGAMTLADAVRYVPAGSVFLAVVDPGVGSSRAAVAVEAPDGALLVGPDNGVLSLAWEELGGAVRAVSIESEGATLHPVSSTFHGRDVLAPAAARLASGADLDLLGPEIPVEGLVVVRRPNASVSDGVIRCEVLAVDHFGNAQLNVREADLDEAGLGSELACEGRAFPLVLTFADLPVGATGAIVDSRGWLAIVVNQGSAASELGVERGSRFTLEAR